MKSVRPTEYRLHDNFCNNKIYIYMNYLYEYFWTTSKSNNADIMHVVHSGFTVGQI